MNLDKLIVRNQNITDELIKKIVFLKNCYWKYPYDSQVKWIQDNLNDDDLHVMIFDGEVLVAYLNLVNLNIAINGMNYSALGVGNVCTAPKYVGKGIGSKSMEEANKQINKNKKLGLLLCHEALITFYQKCGWKEIRKEIVDISIKNDSCKNYLMMYNLKTLFDLHNMNRIEICFYF